ncbi:MAG: hypothetical protein IPL51_10145 [Candidatus Competibacteraceae bacterium]|nr:hypothetical protein [Candidatus Competibacteraceae bacterium]
MTPEELASVTLEHLRHIRKRVDQIASVDIVKARLTSLESQAASIHADMAIVHVRIDRVDSRLDHLERRLDLSDAPP